MHDKKQKKFPVDLLGSNPTTPFFKKAHGLPFAQIHIFEMDSQIDG